QLGGVMNTKVSLTVVALLTAMCSRGGDAKPKVPPTPVVPAPTCADWLDRTVKGFERLPEPRWRDAIVAALPAACATVPQALREAASKATQTRSADEGLRI